MMDSAPQSLRPALDVAVVMRCEPVTGAMSRWQTSRWVLADVVPMRDLPDFAYEGQQVPISLELADPSSAEAVSANAQAARHWLYPGFSVELFADDAEGYYLNAVSPQPCFWVMWRPDELTLPSGELAPAPQIVTLSYHDAGRWLDAQEKVDQVPAPPEVVAWLANWVQENYRPEPKRRQRPGSFQSLTDRFGNPARVSTGRNHGR